MGFAVQTEHKGSRTARCECLSDSRNVFSSHCQNCEQFGPDTPSRIWDTGAASAAGCSDKSILRFLGACFDFFMWP